VAGSVVFGGSFAGSGVVEVLGGGAVGDDVLGAVLGLSGGDAPALGGVGRSQAVRPSEMSNAAAKVIFFMLLLSLETKVLRVMRYARRHARRHARVDITRS
jgi:hypothetical protein